MDWNTLVLKLLEAAPELMADVVLYILKKQAEAQNYTDWRALLESDNADIGEFDKQVVADLLSRRPDAQV